MLKPFEAHNKVIFTLNAVGETTSVTWGMNGTQNLLVKIMGTFFNMDKMMGKDFEVGLEKLKTAAEKYFQTIDLFIIHDTHCFSTSRIK